MQLSNKQRGFSPIFAQVLKFISNFQNFEKKMTLTVYVYPKLQTTRGVVS